MDGSIIKVSRQRTKCSCILSVECLKTVAPAKKKSPAKCSSILSDPFTLLCRYQAYMDHLNND